MVLQPENPLTTGKGPQIVFLLDTSGSMSGSKIDAVKNAMNLFIRLLPENSSFNGNTL
jgi:uncharacterized protein with von Willebrand factor type A (vWA) domain